MSTRNLCLLGATGSIGRNTLAVVDSNPDKYRVHAVAAATNLERMLEICLRYRPARAVMAEAASAHSLRQALAARGVACQVEAGAQAVESLASAPDTDTVVAGIVGAAGLRATWAAVSAGKRVLLANKEALVMAGRLFMNEVKRAGALLLPIDSEHNAILQALPASFDGTLAPHGVRRVMLTASGGPFRATPLHELEGVSAAQACAHPNWVMGPKISVDSATMLNKGLEVIEARWLFDAEPDMIEVVVHPQSIVHSLVEYRDGSVLAQLSHPDMRIPIAHALAFPERVPSGARFLDLCGLGRLDFSPPDLTRFPCLRLAFEVLRAGDAAPIVLNAANEVAVSAFLADRLGFTRIAQVIEATLDRVRCPEPNTLEEVMHIDCLARTAAAAEIERARERQSASPHLIQ